MGIQGHSVTCFWSQWKGDKALNFHYYEQPFENLFLHTYRTACLYMTSGDVQKDEADRDPQNIWDPRKDCGSFVDAISSELSLTNRETSVSSTT